MSLYLVLGPFKALMIDLTLFWQSNIVWPLKKKNFLATLRSSLLLKKCWAAWSSGYGRRHIVKIIGLNLSTGYWMDIFHIDKL